MSLLLVTTGAQAAPSVIGRFSAVQGEVLQNSKQVHEGDPVLLGAAVETQQGKATLLLEKHAVVHLDVESRLLLTQSTLLNLPYGRTRTLIHSPPAGAARRPFSIRTRSATMGVRGTQIYIDSPKDRTQPVSFATLDGLAVVQFDPGKGPKSADGKSDAKPITLAKNESVEVTLSPPEPKKPGSPSGPAAGGAEPPRAAEPPKQELRLAKLTPDRVKDIVEQVGGIAPEMKKPNDPGRANQPPPPPAEAPKDPVYQPVPRGGLTNDLAPRFDPVVDGGVKVRFQAVGRK